MTRDNNTVVTPPEQHQQQQQPTTTTLSAQKALAKSDATILELRSNVRTLKRQCEQLQDNAKIHHEIHSQLEQTRAQLRTAEMVRKELEDTLEAEQYTWELRVQDQDRQILHYLEECTTLQNDLQNVKTQWKEAEEGWTREIQQLQLTLLHQQQENNNHNTLQAKISHLEAERAELQACLDEAMQELEAVDQELQNNTIPNVQARLVALYSWLHSVMQHDPTNININSNHDIPSNIDTLLDDIQDMAQQQQNQLAQLSVYQGNIKAQEESATELRNSLKEAVALLKPLQEAVHKSEQEKTLLQQQLITTHDNDKQLITDLQKQIESLKLQLTMSNNTSSPIPPSSRSLPTTVETSPPLSTTTTPTSSALYLNKKRQQEEALQKLLSSTQSRFQELNQANTKVMAENQALQEQLLLKSTTAAVAESTSTAMVESTQQNNHLAIVEQHSSNLVQELEYTKQELINKTEMEQILNKSLKEALSLLKPLQMHLETSEQEKKSIYKQWKACKKKLASFQGNMNNNNNNLDTSLLTIKSQSSEWPHESQDQQPLDHSINYLEPFQNGPAALKAKEELVELSARYQVTQKKLDTAMMEHNTMLDTLKLYEDNETQLLSELQSLRDKLQKSDHELDNAKYIATSALMKVEELTMEKVVEGGQFQEKVHKLQQQVESAKELNESLETSIQERDSILLSLAEQQHESSPAVMANNNSKGVTWDKNWE